MKVDPYHKKTEYSPKHDALPLRKLTDIVAVEDGGGCIGMHHQARGVIVERSDVEVGAVLKFSH